MVPVYYALPIATHLLFLFPFLFTAFYLFFNERKVNALLVISLLMCMPSAYDILNSLPRGFVNCVFFSSFFVVSLLFPLRQGALLLNLLMIVLGYFISPNTLILSLPFLLFLLLHHYNNKRFYFFGLACVFLYVAFYFVFDYFYKLHPGYVIYGFEHEFSVKYFWQNICNLNEPFVHVSFFMEGNSWTLLSVLAALGGFLFLKNKRAFYAFISFLLLVLFTFLSGKSRDGVLWPWYSYSRMYIGVPLLIGLMTVPINLQFNKTIAVVLVVALAFSGFKFFSYKTQLNRYTDEKLWNGVHLVSLKSALEAMNFYKENIRKKGVDYFLISNGFWLNTFLDYGGPAVYDDFPQTQETNSERRYWVREGNKNKVFKKFVLLSCKYNLDELIPVNNNFKLERIDDYGLLLVTNNRLSNDDFIKTVKKYESLP
jgi:hypothetical protein